MKSTGIVRRVDDLGRVVIPKEIRRTHGLADGDPVEIFVNGDQIILRKYSPGCVLCGNTGSLQSISGKSVCVNCIKLVSQEGWKIAAEPAVQEAGVRE